MDKIIGLGNALVDVLATLKDDTLLDEMGLPKGSMQLIDDAKLQQINERFSRMKTHLATGGAAANTILGLACLGAGTGFIGKIGNDAYGNFFRANLQRNGFLSQGQRIIQRLGPAGNQIINRLVAFLRSVLVYRFP